MRIEELSEQRALKSPDSVEKYLLSLIEDYFSKTDYTAPASREYVINQAVKRLKEEVDFETLGVLSIKLPDDEEPRTGAINISLEELGGEPIILDKKTAFNVPFGDTKNTACEGNDPRLSDARTPLPHTHRISDIQGINGIISSLDGKLQRIEEFKHEHTNKSVLDMLIYTGDKEYIDLEILDHLDDDIKLLIEDVINEIIGYKTEATQKVDAINTKIQDIKDRIETLHNFVETSNATNLSEAKEYTDERVAEVREIIDEALSHSVLKEDFERILGYAHNSYIFVGQGSIHIQQAFDIHNFSLIGGNPSHNNRFEFDIDPSILATVGSHDKTLYNCIFEPYILYGGYQQQLPYSFLKDGTKEDGYITLEFNLDTAKAILTMSSETLSLPVEVNDSTIIYKVYCEQKIDYTLGY